MNKKQLKKDAKKVLKRNYLTIILVTFIIGVIITGGYNFTTIISGNNANNVNGTNGNF